MVAVLQYGIQTVQLYVPGCTAKQYVLQYKYMYMYIGTLYIKRHGRSLLLSTSMMGRGGLYRYEEPYTIDRPTE